MINLKEGYIKSPQPWDYVLNRRETFEVLPKKQNCIMFVGDSITQRNEWAEMFNNYNIINRGIDSDRIPWLYKRTDNLLQNNPSKIFLKIGINDIMDGKPKNQFLEEYEILLNKFKTLNNCEIYVQSCLPVNNSKYKHPINNQIVKQINDGLCILCKKLQVNFINLYDSFLNENQELNENFTKDGVHLNGDGYLIWKDKIEKYI